MENTVKQRLMAFIKAKGIKIGTFERLSGLSNGYLNQLRKEPSVSKIDMICDAFPEINREWLMTGDGEMLSPKEKNDEPKFRTIPDNALVKALQDHINDLQSERDRLLEEREYLRNEIDRLRSLLNIEPQREKDAV